MNDDRAEQAFRSALATRAAAYQPPATALPNPALRRRWPRALAAAAAVLALAVTGALVHAHRPAPPSADLPAGWRWESYRDVEVGVPDSWGYFSAPTDQWCVSYTASGKPHGNGSLPPRGGYVDTNNPTSASTLVRCESDVPPVQVFAVHVSLGASSRPAGVPAGWMNVHRALGGVVLNVVTDPAHRELADRILATAHTDTVDHNGCTATSSVQSPQLARPPAFDLARVTSVDSISVCLYDVGSTAHPGLVASRRVTGAAAVHELAALRAAPPVPGPKVSCPFPDVGGQNVVLRLHTGSVTHDVFMRYDSCYGTGMDDGTRMRALTTPDCSHLWDPRLQLTEGKEQVFETCVPDLS